jgi:hypothetical protein
LSQAAFARQLSVTPLTVHRWELPDGNKEARRPRGKILERLQRLAAGGTSLAVDVGGAPLALEPPDVERATPTPDVLPADPAFAKDEPIVLPLLDRLHTREWARAEDELLGLLESRALATAGGRALASLGLALVQLFMRLDVRGARTTWAPVAEDAESGKLPVPVAARAYVLGALLFSARDDRSFDPVRTASYVAPRRFSARETTTSASSSCARASRRPATPIYAAPWRRTARMPPWPIGRDRRWRSSSRSHCAGSRLMGQETKRPPPTTRSRHARWLSISGSAAGTSRSSPTRSTG